MCWSHIDRGLDVAKDFLPLFTVVGDTRRLKMNFQEVIKAVITAAIVAAVLYGQQQVQQKEIAVLQDVQQESIREFSAKIDKLENRIESLQDQIILLRIKAR